jgi:hypothetical protein
LIFLGKWPFFSSRLSMALNLRPLPLLLLTKRHLLQRQDLTWCPSILH